MLANKRVCMGQTSNERFVSTIQTRLTHPSEVQIMKRQILGWINADQARNKISEAETEMLKTAYGVSGKVTFPHLTC